MLMIVRVTQQDEDAEQDGDESPGAEAGRGEEGLGSAGR